MWRVFAWNCIVAVDSDLQAILDARESLDVCSQTSAGVGRAGAARQAGRRRTGVAASAMLNALLRTSHPLR